MNAIIRNAALLISAATVGALVVALPAGASPTSAQVLALSGRFTDTRVVDLEPRGLNAGDRYMERSVLTGKGSRAGTASTDCAIVRLLGGNTAAGFPKAEYLCTTVFKLKGGDLVAHANFDYVEDAAPVRVVVVGGSGRFAGASGNAVISDTTAKGFTLRIVLR